MKHKAVIIDMYSHGSYHEVINQAYLMMISDIYEEVTYIADKSSCENLKSLLDKCGVRKNNIIFKEKHVKKYKIKNRGIAYLVKLLTTSYLNYKYYNKAPKDSDVFYNNNLFFAILLISIFSKKDKNIFDLCHNEMELIDKSSVSSVASSILSKYLRFVFCKVKLNKIFHFILLSPDMVDYFRTFISKHNYERIFWIDHSYIRPENKIDVKYQITDNRIKIGIPGAITSSRGLSTLKYLLANLKNQNICIYALSTCSEMIEADNFVVLNKGRGLLPFEQYNAYVQSMDVMLLLYDTDSYKLTASGAVLEAIWNEKPIIALKNAYFSYLFKKFGQMGFLCNNIDDLCLALSKLDNASKYISKIQFAKQALMPNYVKQQLLSIITHV